MTNHGRLVPSFIEARSPKGLRVAMIKNNTKYGKQFQYFDIQNYMKGNELKWIVWFHIELNSENAAELLSDKGSKNDKV